MKSGSEDEIIFQLVPCTFLHLQSTVSIKRNGERAEAQGKTTDPQPASRVGFHDHSHVVHQLSEGASDLPMLDHKALGSII